jgi:cytochrome c-type biogenesis protein CcmE
VARKGSPARLVIALSVAAVLAVFLLYTSLAGGRSPSVSPSTLAGKTGAVQLKGKVVGPISGDAHETPLRFKLRDIEGNDPATVAVVYTGTVSDQFRAGRDVLVEGTLKNGVFEAKHDSLVTKCPSKYTAVKTAGP